MSTVLVSVNFVGRYNKENVGHEFINLFPSDDGKWNFYISPYGIVKEECDKLDYLLLVEHINKKYSLLAIATNLISSGVYSISKNDNQNKVSVQDENKENGEIKYFNKALKDWFKNQDNTLYVSYKLSNNGKVYVPKKEIILELEAKEKDKNNDKNKDKIVVKKNCIYLPRTYFDKGETKEKDKERKQITGQSQSGYFRIDKFEQKFSAIEQYLEDATNTTNNKAVIPSFKKSLLDIIGRPSDELAFSNWLNTYLKNDLFFDYFLENCLSLPLSKKDNRKAKVEQSTSNRNRVDLWLENDEYIVLIENKVQSSIHTSKTKDDQIVSQLDDYYKKGEEEKKKRNKSLKAFLICPDYYNSYYHVENINGTTLWDKDKWVEIPYSKIKKTVNKFINEKLKTEEDKKKYPYIEDFVDAIEKHCKTTPFSMKDIILDRIARKL